MFGHGASRCKVRTFCAKCAGSHNTEECKIEIFKCANCNGPHKSNSFQCPSRQNYIEIKKRFSNKKIIARRSIPNQNYNQNFPNSLRQENPPSAYNWTHQNSSNNAQKDNLFTKFKTLHYNLLID